MDQHSLLPGIILALVGAVLIRVGQALRVVDNNLAEFPDD